ncbi:MAG: hypothetical protein JO190_08775 [Candidatus Eremiobacteraeota bacterium]|nr:hypothetical protein [Candidatus Eremiobacteraeota bacterium]MBV8498809.1 hypothetical protein [Candidatus Eremiobacteraeota bacterium]
MLFRRRPKALGRTAAAEQRERRTAQRTADQSQRLRSGARTGGDSRYIVKEIIHRQETHVLATHLGLDGGQHEIFAPRPQHVVEQQKLPVRPKQQICPGAQQPCRLNLLAQQACPLGQQYMLLQQSDP